MSDVFFVKQDSDAPSITATLTDHNGTPVNLTGVVTFKMSGEGGEHGGTANIISASAGTVAYDWQTGDLAEWGGYAAEWTHVDGGNTEVFPAAGYNWVEVLPRVDTVVGGVTTLLDVRRKLRRELTDDESVTALALIAEFSALLTRKLNRYFATTVITDERHVIDSRGDLRLYYGPVLSVDSVTVDGSEYASPLTDYDQIVWAESSVLLVTYTVGSVADAGVRGAVAQVIARTIQSDPTIATGAIKGYTVEGTSIQYGDFSGTATGSQGPFTVGEWSAFSRLRRPILWT